MHDERFGTVLLLQKILVDDFKHFSTITWHLGPQIHWPSQELYESYPMVRPSVPRSQVASRQGTTGVQQRCSILALVIETKSYNSNKHMITRINGKNKNPDDYKMVRISEPSDFKMVRIDRWFKNNCTSCCFLLVDKACSQSSE